MVQQSTTTQKQNGQFFTVFVDEIEYRFETSIVTGGEIMDTADIPRSIGLVLINADGTQERIGADEEIELKPGRRFKKAPRFKRGAA